MTYSAHSATPVLLLLTILLTVLAMGCGSASRKYLIVERADSGDLIDAINRASLARGFDTRVRENQLVKFYLDAESGTRLYFQAKRNGIVLVVRVNAEEGVPVDVQEGEFIRGEAIGREIMQEARVLHAEVNRQQQMALQEEAAQEQRDAVAREQREADQSQQGQDNQQNQDLADFMAQNQDRNRGFAGAGAASQTSGEAGTDSPASDSNDSSMHCCVNGAFYACPSAAAIDQCVGEFTRCISGCGMECMEECLQTHPPDPSSCSRDGSRDSEC